MHSFLASKERLLLKLSQPQEDPAGSGGRGSGRGILSWQMADVFCIHALHLDGLIVAEGHSVDLLF